MIPCSSRNLTSSTCPSWAASIRGVDEPCSMAAPFKKNKKVLLFMFFIFCFGQRLAFSYSKLPCLTFSPGLKKKHPNFQLPNKMYFLLPPSIITNTEIQTHKMDQNPSITHHKPWSFQLLDKPSVFWDVSWLMAAKKANACKLLAFELQSSHVIESVFQPHE